MRSARDRCERRTATRWSLFVFLGLVCCSSPPPTAFDPADWFAPASHVVLWDVYADAVESARLSGAAGELPPWVVARAAADLATLDGGEIDFGERFMVSGIERLGLLPDDVRAALFDEEFEPLGPRAEPTWRIELERDLAPLSEAERRVHLERELVKHWAEALANANLEHVARLVEVVDEHALHDLLPDDGRVAVHALLVAIEPTANSMHVAPAAVALMERRGVPATLDLTAWRKALRARIEQLRRATIPLPHPHDLELALARLR
jgi:hypothetical protein